MNWSKKRSDWPADARHAASVMDRSKVCHICDGMREVVSDREILRLKTVKAVIITKFFLKFGPVLNPY